MKFVVHVLTRNVLLFACFTIKTCEALCYVVSSNRCRMSSIHIVAFTTGEFPEQNRIVKPLTYYKPFYQVATYFHLCPIGLSGRSRNILY